MCTGADPLLNISLDRRHNLPRRGHCPRDTHAHADVYSRDGCGERRTWRGGAGDVLNRDFG